MDNFTFRKNINDCLSISVNEKKAHIYFVSPDEFPSTFVEISLDAEARKRIKEWVDGLDPGYQSSLSFDDFFIYYNVLGDGLAQFVAELDKGAVTVQVYTLLEMDELVKLAEIL